MSGVQCSNCYLYAGADIVADLNYESSGSSIQFEAAIQGAAGFNVNVEINNPAISGSSGPQVLISGQGSAGSAPSGAGNIPIGTTGVSLTYWSGNLVATVSGSGSATGSAAFQMGASANAQLGVEYSGSWQDISNANFGMSGPTFTSTGFTNAALTVTLQLAGTEYFFIGYSGTLASVGLYFDTTLSTTAEYSYSQASLTPLTVSVGGASTFTVGDTVPITVSYKNWAPNEEHHLFYSFLTPAMNADAEAANEGFPIIHAVFTTSASGTGSYSVDWVVPANAIFTQEMGTTAASTISVHASNKMSQKIPSSPIAITFPDATTVVSNPLFSQPTSGEVVAANKPYTIAWNVNHLSYFAAQQGTGGFGTVQVVDNVNLVVVAQKLASDGSVTSSTAFDLVSAVTNTGSASVTFSSTLMTSGDRFFVTILDTRYSSIFGVSTGYFALSNVGTPAPALVETKLGAPSSTSKPLWSGSSSMSVSSIVPAVASSLAHRRLQSCSGSTPEGDYPKCYFNIQPR